MRDLAGLTVGLIVGATIVSLVHLFNDTKERREAANMVPIGQCLEALLSTQPRAKP